MPRIRTGSTPCFKNQSMAGDNPGGTVSLPATTRRKGSLDSIEEEDFQDGVEQSPTEPPRKRMRSSHDCDICGTSYTEKRSLVRHYSSPTHRRRIGSKVLQYFCDYCPQDFTRDDGRQRHEKEIHFDIKRSARTFNDADGRNASQADSFDFDFGFEAETAAEAGEQGLYETYDLYSDEIDSTTSGTLLPTISGECSYHALCEPFRTTQPSDHVGIASGAHSGQNDHLLGLKNKDSAIDLSYVSPTISNGSVATSDHNDKPMANSSLFDAVSAFPIPRSDLPRAPELIMESPYPTFVMLTRNRSSLIKKGASTRFNPSKSSLPCPICHKPFGDTLSEIRNHLDRHSKEFEGEHICNICEIGFTHYADLEKHEASAREGHCGFDFLHTTLCQGHHAPEDNSGLSDNNRLRLCIRLRHWETAQLSAYLSHVNVLLANKSACNGAERWTIGAIRQSTEELLVSRFSDLTLQSTPDTMEHQAGMYSTEFQGSPWTRLNTFPRDFVTQAASLLKTGPSTHEIDYRDQLYMLASIGSLDSNNAHMNALAYSLRKGKHNAARWLLESGKRSNFEGGTYESMLGQASHSGHDEVVGCLISLGADVNSKYPLLGSPLGCAVAGGHAKIVGRLLTHGAVPGTVNQLHQVFMHASSSRSQAITDLLRWHLRGSRVLDAVESESLGDDWQRDL